MEHDRGTDVGTGWPQPHPSPPPPPPREYGSPGTPPRRPTELWLPAAAVAVAVVVFVALGALLLRPDGHHDGHHVGHHDDAAGPAPDPSPAAPTSSSAAPPSTRPAATQSAAPAAYHCWDGTPAQALTDCSLPTGADGLAWVFPHLSDQHCGAPTRSGDGVVLRVLCTTKLHDGSRVQVGYYAWESVQDGVAFYEDQGLTASDGAGLRGWTGTSGDTFKSALMYVDAPFSQTVTLPATAAVGAKDLQMLSPRPPDQVRGEPAG